MHRSIAAAVLLLLCVGLPVFGAEASCRDFRTKIEQRDMREQIDMSRVIAVNSEKLPTFDWPAREPNATFALKGIFCGPSRKGLPTQTMYLVRYKDLRDRESKGRALPAQAFTDGSVESEEEFEIETSEEGRFSIAGLPPGNYAFRVDWEALESQIDFVIFDIRLIPGQAIFLDAPKADVFGGS